MSQTQNKLAGKLVKILGALGGVEKKGYNAHQKYYYMREVDVMEALKAQLIAEKIIMLTSSKFADIQKKEGKDGKVEFVTTVETIHTFLDSETGEQLSITSVGSGYDSSDKGASKAITAAVKYAIMKTFMISDEGADIENDGKTVAAPVAAPKTFTAPAVVKTEPAAVVAEVKAEPPPPKVTVPAAKSTAKGFGPAPVIAPAAVATPTPAPALSKRKAAATEPSFP